MHELDLRKVRQVLFDVGRDQREYHHADLRAHERRVCDFRVAGSRDEIWVLVRFQVKCVTVTRDKHLQKLIELFHMGGLIGLRRGMECKNQGMSGVAR